MVLALVVALIVVAAVVYFARSGVGLGGPRATATSAGSAARAPTPAAT
jgi:hypothetical protein